MTSLQPINAEFSSKDKPYSYYLFMYNLIDTVNLTHDVCCSNERDLHVKLVTSLF